MIKWQTHGIHPLKEQQKMIAVWHILLENSTSAKQIDEWVHFCNTSKLLFKIMLDDVTQFWKVLHAFFVNFLNVGGISATLLISKGVPVFDRKKWDSYLCAQIITVFKQSTYTPLGLNSTNNWE